MPVRLALLLLLAALPARAGELAAAVDDALALARAAREDARVPPAYRTPLPPAADAPSGEAYCVFASAPGDGGLQFCRNEAEVHGFQLTNSTSPRINPFGRAVKRQWEFMAPGRARRELGLLVYEWSSPDDGADDSANSMMTEIVFLPRRVVPAIRLLPGGAAYEVTLPTGETMTFDAATKEVTGGPLSETAPLDANPDRHARRFAALRYAGSGITIRSDQRGDTPRSSVVWGIKKLVVATWGAKTCRFSPAEVWKQDASGSGSDVLYETDAGFYAMLKRKCGWDVIVPSEGPRP